MVTVSTVLVTRGQRLCHQGLSGAVRGCLVIRERPGAYWLHRADLRERHVSVSTYQEEALAN